ncbi:MAG: hypothetical protein ACI4XJ_00205 [Eubacteriales bacterium]
MNLKTGKQLSLLLALLIMLSSMNSCAGETKESTAGNSKTDESTESVSAETEEDVPEKITADLPDVKWDGRVFNVLGEDGGTYQQFSNFEIFADEMTAEPVNDAIFTRNQTIESRYDVKITQELYMNQGDLLAATHAAGEKNYDCFFQQIRYIGSTALNGYLFNLNNNEYIDFEKPYWNKDVNEKVSAYGKLYFTTSDFSLRDKNRAYIMLYNTDLAAAYQIPNIVDIVREGKWTIDLMTQYIELIADDLNGDGKMDYYDDQWGLVMDSPNAIATLFYGLDNILIQKDAEDALILPENLEHITNSIDKVITAGCNRQAAFYSDSSDWSSFVNSYKAGKALFVTLFPHSLQGIYSSCEFGSTVIPYPKFNEEQQNYFTMADIFCMMFGIPSSCSDENFSGFMLEALSCESTETSLHAYYEVSCKTKYSYNAESSEMLDLIFSGIRYEPAMIYNITGLFEIVSQKIPDAGQNNFASLYASLKKPAQKKIGNLQTSFEELDY